MVHHKIAASTLPARCNSRLLTSVLWHLRAEVIKSSNEPLLTARELQSLAAHPEKAGYASNLGGIDV